MTVFAVLSVFTILTVLAAVSGIAASLHAVEDNTKNRASRALQLVLDLLRRSVAHGSAFNDHYSAIAVLRDHGCVDDLSQRRRIDENIVVVTLFLFEKVFKLRVAEHLRGVRRICAREDNVQIFLIRMVYDLFLGLDLAA